MEIMVKGLLSLRCYSMKNPTWQLYSAVQYCEGN